MIANAATAIPNQRPYWPPREIDKRRQALERREADHDPAPGLEVTDTKWVFPTKK